MSFSTPTISSSGFTTTSSFVLTAPTGIILGSVLIFHIGYIGSGLTITTPAGWSLVRQDAGTITHAVYYKVATATEVAASNFTFGLSSSSNCAGGMMNFVQANNVTPVNANNGVTTASAVGSVPITITYSITITPAANSILIMFVFNQMTGSNSAFAVTTTNPTWTIGYDYNNGSTNSLAMAYSSQRTPNTATGNATSNQSSASNNPKMGMILAISPAVLISAADTQSTTDTAVVSKTTHIAVTESQPVSDTAVILRKKTFHNQSKTAMTDIKNLPKS